MSIRSTVKAIVVHDGHILLNTCRDPHNGEYTSLPGGGQQPFETLTDALVRECLEETGYKVIPLRFCALFEEICTDPTLRTAWPDYTHKVHHIFLCALDTAYPPVAPQEQDTMQTGIRWLPLDALSHIRLLPEAVAAALPTLIDGASPSFLGSAHIRHGHA